MEIIYRAFDGTEFCDKNACRAYESELRVRRWKKKVAAFDEDLRAIDPGEFDGTYYINIKDEDAWENYAKDCKENNSVPPESAGAWKFNEWCGAWEPLGVEIAEVSERLNCLDNINTYFEEGE